jgi:hypothetical protein
MNVLISQALVRRLLNGPGFFQAFPEFAALQPLISAKPADLVPCRGCGGSRAHEERIVGAFVNVLRSLPENRRRQLKDRAGASTFQFNGYNNRLRQAEVMQL